MILIVGASGHLGSLIVERLLAQGMQLRLLSRRPETLARWREQGVEIIKGDLRDPRSLAAACQGMTQVVTTAHASEGMRGNTPVEVDLLGNRALIAAANRAGVEQFVFISARSAQPDSPVDLFRFKYRSEQELRASGLAYTILRPTHLMDTWVDLLGQQILTQQRVTLFGRGDNPLCLVAAADIAAFTVMTLKEPAARNQTLTIGGSERHTLRQVVAYFERLLDRPIRVRAIPRPVLRLTALGMRPFNPVLSRQAMMAWLVDTHDQMVEMAETLQRYPVHLTPLAEFVAQYMRDRTDDVVPAAGALHGTEASLP
jgi:NADH dehydrogenase